MASAAAALKALEGNADVLGVSLVGDPERLAAALGKLRKEGVKVTWICALEMPEHIAELLEGVLDDRSRGTRDRASDVRAYFTLIDTAQFYYRNYQDESLYATVARYLASGVKPCAWEPDVKAAVEGGASSTATMC